jgi:hypothetical protein
MKISILGAGMVLSFCAMAQDSPTVQPFLPEIISAFPSVRDLAMTADETEIYFTIQSPLGEASAIVMSRSVNGSWSKPEVLPFSGKYSDMEPFLSPNGLRLYFVSNRPADNTSAAKDYDIWVTERKDARAAWSEPKNIGAPVNTTENEFYPSVSNLNNLVFTRDGAGSKGKDDIFFCKWNNGLYGAPASMNDSINTDGFEFNAFLAPDESFLLFTCYNRKGGYGSGDIHISYNKGNYQWTKSENLGKEINSSMMDYCPFVNVKTGILYFTSRRSSVKKQFDKTLNTQELLKEMNKYDNGLSRIYQVNTKGTPLKLAPAKQ